MQTAVSYQLIDKINNIRPIRITHFKKERVPITAKVSIFHQIDVFEGGIAYLCWSVVVQERQLGCL